MSREFIAGPGGRVQGQVRIPGDKSISHRSVMLGALATGDSRVSGFLDGADCLATMHVFQALGVNISQQQDVLHVHGVGLHGLKPAQSTLDVGNSGTSMRLLAGLLAGQDFDSTLTGDASLRSRPMARVMKPLAAMGANISGEQGDTAPLSIQGKSSLNPLHYRMPVASAQVKSCLLLAGLCGDAEVQITEPGPSRDHTERMLAAFGVSLQQGQGTVTLSGSQPLTACDFSVPGDLSSAAFFLVAAVITPGAELLIEGVGVNPTRAGVLNILRTMGADITLMNQRDEGAEPVADIQIRGSNLHGIEIDPAQVPLAIDEFPALFIAAACAQGKTVLRGAQELRVKESDRIAVMAEGLTALGVDVETFADGIAITGGPIHGGTVDSHSDHRIAMAFAVASLRADAAITVRDCSNVDTSFPGFVDMARAVGMNIEVSETSKPDK